jgi:hypothetical protein
MKKAIWTLNIDNYAPEIRELTFPAMEFWAKKIGAEFKVITERKFPGWPVVYEKLQLAELGRDFDWNIFLDADAIVSPEMFDPTEHLGKNEILHWGADMAGNRWRYDDYFRRDGRHIGSGNWFTVASNWCLDLWHPLEDLTLEQAAANIFPTVPELRVGIKPEHLIDDYTLSRNIARYGLKVFTFIELLKSLGREKEAFNTYFWHTHLASPEEKLIGIREALRVWNPNPTLWDKALDILKDKVGVKDYLTWLQPTKFHHQDGFDLHIQIPDPVFKHVLNQRLAKPIKAVLPQYRIHYVSGD